MKKKRTLGEAENDLDLINRYGTYNIQRTADTFNTFPAIAQGLPRSLNKAIDKEEAEKIAKENGRIF